MCVDYRIITLECSRVLLTRLSHGNYFTAAFRRVSFSECKFRIRRDFYDEGAASVYISIVFDAGMWGGGIEFQVWQCMSMCLFRLRRVFAIYIIFYSLL